MTLHQFFYSLSTPPYISQFEIGPTLHVWYGTIARLIPATDFKAAIQKMLIDQTMFGPFLLSGFLSVNSILAGDSLQQTGKKLQRDLWPALKANWTVWPAAMLINFRYVPVQYQVLYVSSVAFCWNIYLSTLANKKLPKISAEL